MIYLFYPCTKIRLCSPSSTSYNPIIATTFSGNHGILVRLNNTVYGHNDLRGFPCAWISAFPEESEVLFFGGHYMITVESIKGNLIKCLMDKL